MVKEIGVSAFFVEGFTEKSVFVTVMNEGRSSRVLMDDVVMVDLHSEQHAIQTEWDLGCVKNALVDRNNARMRVRLEQPSRNIGRQYVVKTSKVVEDKTI